MSYISDRKEQLLNDEKDKICRFIVDTVKKDADSAIISGVNKIDKTYHYNISSMPHTLGSKDISEIFNSYKSNSTSLERYNDSIIFIKEKLIELGFENVTVKLLYFEYLAKMMRDEKISYIPIYVHAEM